MNKIKFVYIVGLLFLALTVRPAQAILFAAIAAGNAAMSQHQHVQHSLQSARDQIQQWLANNSTAPTPNTLDMQEMISQPEYCEVMVTLNTSRDPRIAIAMEMLALSSRSRSHAFSKLHNAELQPPTIIALKTLIGLHFNMPQIARVLSTQKLTPEIVRSLGFEPEKLDDLIKYTSQKILSLQADAQRAESEMHYFEYNMGSYSDDYAYEAARTRSLEALNQIDYFARRKLLLETLKRSLSN